MEKNPLPLYSFEAVQSYRVDTTLQASNEIKVENIL